MSSSNVQGPKNEPFISQNQISSSQSSETTRKITPDKISKLDVSGLEGLGAKIAVKAERFLNFLKLVGGFINARTIMAGSSVNWDVKRLKERKHKELEAIGAESITLKSKTGCKVDGHYLSATAFMKRLEELGGKRQNLELEIVNPLLNKGKKCVLEVNGSPIEMHEIEVSEEMRAGNPLWTFLVKKQFDALLGKATFIFCTPEGKFYLTDFEGLEKIVNEKLIDITGKTINMFKNDVQIKNITEKESPFVTETSFPGIKFDKTVVDCSEIKNVLKNLKLSNSTWSLVETSEALFITPSAHISQVKLAFEPGNHVKLIEKEAKPLDETASRGTVLLTMNQTNIYEQYSHEMLTLAFEGVDVMMYNNPGKGLSTGSADIENINASIEASYQYLKHRGIPDEKILAKGQCFGAAPTAWLGKKHPHLNLMMDQNPANFYDIAIAKIYEIADELDAKDRNIFIRWAGKMLRDNFVINGIARALFSGYNVADDLRHNKGHKIFHLDVPDNGLGGDELVPEHHLALMLSNLPETPDRKVAISMNPGGKHVTDWWLSPESKESVLTFLKRTGISRSLFE
ncbi:MAG TPA: hypothetical protein PLC42_07175 [Parachlamydiaceae bacterium]|nr:hypothetical protein [Parachlamydiaceae bacterium]